ncbi:glycine zipper 2TM domain-containing protein [Olivibacter sp. SDN3]|uniref:YMGG-like glycine zipper-containing protein n=1 Tax=Olivibacter sp. SDN3 TaxID=2764720 RepID=UPI0016512649|nr:YMGG-like glycine zipper-containing protein [Olivibacter sp. SDN3]QNL49311.1 glycine zipper 2TM domain-containing protein [Olivibacter sp. SDN3]
MNRIIAMCLIAGISVTACNSNNKTTEEAIAKEAALKHLKDSLTLDSFRNAEAAEKAGLAQEETADQDFQQPYGRPSAADNENTNQEEQYDEVGTSNTPQQPVATNKKKGWSDAAKGTAIGAGVGAGVGALIDKDKRLRGAAIGAAIGGGGGYAIGRKSDRKSGRAQKK